MDKYADNNDKEDYAMSNTIAGINSSVPHVAAQGVSQPGATQTVQKPAAAQHQAVTVELSKAAQVRSLKRSGQTIAQIALNMGLDAKTVNNYLGTTPAPQVK